MNITLTKELSILIVDDEKGIRHGLKNMMQKENFLVYESSNFEGAISIANKNIIDVVLIDIRLKSSQNGIDLLKELKKLEPDIIAIIITGYGSIESAVTAMKEGANDYILKPIDNRSLLDTIQKNIQLRNLKNENYYLKKEIINRYTHKFITRNPELSSLISSKIDKIKNNPVTVLISGESGTGKEVLARYIHFTSNRKDSKFVAINCAALSESLLLSELFGHEKGAFTGAVERKIGKIEIAHKGTLFLDEIGDMHLDIQAKLLRVIEEQSFERIGGTKRIRVDIRIVAATNKDLIRQIKSGTFREDLYYRLNVVSLHLPPLRERIEDIPLLVEHFIDKYNRMYNKKVEEFEEKALNALSRYNWPGNIRELENVVNQTILLSNSPLITEGDLSKSLFRGAQTGEAIMDYSNITSLKETVDKVKEDFEKKIIQHFLRMHSYNKSKTAETLSITRKTLSGKIQKYRISRY